MVSSPSSRSVSSEEIPPTLAVDLVTWSRKKRPIGRVTERESELTLDRRGTPVPQSGDLGVMGRGLRGRTVN